MEEEGKTIDFEKEFIDQHIEDISQNIGNELSQKLRDIIEQYNNVNDDDNNGN